MKRIICVALSCVLHFSYVIAQNPGYMPIGDPDSGGIADIALIYQGGIERLDWNKEQLAPHVSWINPETMHEEWLFDGFLFIEFKDFRGNLFAKGYGGETASKPVLEWFLDRIFEKNVAVDALDHVVGETISRIGAPPTVRKVILTVPEPIRGYKDWGTLNGKALDFDIQEDRVASVEWFIDRLLARWETADFKNIELAGFYWVAEEMGEDDTDLIRKTGKYISEKGKHFYWIPWFGAPGAPNWKELGFDAAYQQPNYFFKTTVPVSQLDEACHLAREKNMGLEMEWDARVWENKQEFLPRMSEYLNRFENEGVLRYAAMAHYMGGSGLYKMLPEIEKDKDVKDMYIRYCSIISARQNLLKLLLSP